MIENAIIPIERIHPHPENYNLHPDEQIRQLEASYEEFGQFNSIVVWKQADGSYVQVARAGFLTGAKNKGASTIRADILPEETDPLVIKRIMIADNRLAQNSVIDEGILARLLQEQVDADYSLFALGTDEEELRQMIERPDGRTTELNPPQGGHVESAYNVLIECENEQEQQRAYELVEQEGFKCRILTL